jgi:serine/threonine protein kinase
MVAVVLHLTSNKIVHRDLKLDKFVLNNKNIILTDFGLSKENAQLIIEMGCFQTS